MLLPAPGAGDRLRAALTDLLPLAVGLFDPVAGEVQAVASGVTIAPFDSRMPEWADRVRARFDGDLSSIDLSPSDRAAPTGRTTRSNAFGPLLSRMREVLDLDPVAIW